MEEFWILILVAIITTNSLDKAESVKVKLEETPLKTFDEIFGEGWWDKGEAAEDLKTPAPTNFRQNVHHQIHRQNTQIGQIEPNSTDQNPPFTESDHYDNANLIINIAENERKRKIIDKFHAMRDEFKQKGRYSKEQWNQIENKIAKHLKVSRTKIYKWKKEFGLSRRNPKNERKHLVEKFDQIKAELTRAGFKNSYSNQIDETVAKELGLSFKTIYRWKSELGQSRPNYSDNEKFEIVKKLMKIKSERSGKDKKSCKNRRPKHNEQKELMKRYYEIKYQNPKVSDGDIAKMLKIGRITLIRWKKLHPNSVDGQVEENAAANVQEIGNSNSGSS